ncbi:MAG: SDR family NAD(P)-dependent oxidoreductase, partial [Burkholderiaceae bacterium]
MDINDFKGCAVFVAGGSSGINLGIAKAFAASGASVAIASRSPERVTGAVAELRALAAPGARIEGYSADVRDAEAIAAVL